jgi:hypothetical protein
MNAVAIPLHPEEQSHALTSTGTTPADLLRIAVAGGADLDRLDKLMALQERWEANEARKAFVAAMVAFKAEPMVIGKNKHVSFTTQKGKTEYDHAELSDVTAVVVPNLAKHGLSHGWVVEQDGKGITVVCTITHALGHSQSVRMTAAADDSGGKNAIQAVASTNTYLQRYTLLAACGLATGGDDDGRGAYPVTDLGTASTEDLETELDNRRARFCQQLAGQHSESIQHIKDRITAGDIPAAVAEWQQFSQDEQRALWVAPSKGGVFSTAEREAIRKGIAAQSTKEADHD